ncbi:MAG: alpha/beta hydrolase [Caldilineaceae bacterium]|nr:alpha/beta hydrolase [Caldilineaceae bacterium]
MKTVISKDHTPIVYEAGGNGPALLLVHGGGSTPERWRPILPRFESSFTVYRVSRRGVGGSGAASDYTVERQSEDIAAVVDAIGGAVDLLGHSFGGLCALEGALLTANVRRLILYEPPIVPLLPPGFVDRLEALLKAGDRDGVWATMNREIVKMPEHEIALQRGQPAHTARLAGIHVLVYEARALEHYQFDPVRYAALTVPTLLLVGGDSPAWAQDATRRLCQAVGSSRVVVMPGQQHIAMDTAPDLFVREVMAFLSAL